MSLEKYDLLEAYTEPVRKPERAIVGRKNEMDELQAAFLRPELCNVILLGEAGSGKALPDDTLIYSEYGLRHLDTLKAGDRVFAPDGSLCAINSVYIQGDKPVLEMQFETGLTLKCCPEHLQIFLDENHNPLVITASEAQKAVLEHKTLYMMPSGCLDFEEIVPGEIRYADLPNNILYSRPDIRQGALMSALENAEADKLDLQKIKGCFTDRGLIVLAATLGLRMHEENGQLHFDNFRYPTLVPDGTLFALKNVIDTGKKTPMRCIRVDHFEHLYLAGELCIPTHNTALVQGTMMSDPQKRLYREVNLTRMIADIEDASHLAAKLKELFYQTEQFAANEKREIVLFIDEFHQIVQLSAAAVEVLKPLLAASGTRGIRVVAATTYEEFNQYIAPNQPLVERLQRISLPQTDEKTTVEILRQMAERYGVGRSIYDDYLYHRIYEYTERYVPASSQPRKSLLVLDAMIGWHKKDHVPLDRRLLAKVLYQMHQVKVNFTVDATAIEERLNEHVLSQTLATRTVAERLQICVADLNDHTRPMASFLFTGSTGVGKTELVKQMADILFEDRRNLIRFDMTEFAMENRLDDFRETLTARVWERPFSIILLDEIEKAAPNVVRLLMQVLDDARLTNQHGREVSFLNAYIVMTTNAGSEIYKTIAQYEADDTGSGKAMADYDALIRRSITTTTNNRFPPELLGRIDCMVPFQPLTPNTKMKIAAKKLQDLARRVKDSSNVFVTFDETDIIEYLVLNALSKDSDSGGARALAGRIETDITQSIAAYINSHPKATQIHVGLEGTLRSRDKSRLKSDACIFVSETVRQLDKPFDQATERLKQYQKFLFDEKSIRVAFSQNMVRNLVKLSYADLDEIIEEKILSPLELYIEQYPQHRNLQVQEAPHSTHDELFHVVVTPSRLNRTH